EASRETPPRSPCSGPSADGRERGDGARGTSAVPAAAVAADGGSAAVAAASVLGSLVLLAVVVVVTQVPLFVRVDELPAAPAADGAGRDPGCPRSAQALVLGSVAASDGAGPAGHAMPPRQARSPGSDAHRGLGSS